MLSRLSCHFRNLVSTCRPVVQLVEHRSPKPAVGGSSPSWPATLIFENGYLYECCGRR